MTAKKQNSCTIVVSGKQVSFEVKDVTPEWARTVLETKNTRNRPKNEKRAAAYASDMRRGVFIPTHQGIAFDEEGTLIDGQTRLAAVVIAGSPVTMVISTGWPRKTIGKNGVEVDGLDPLDGGQLRGLGQKLRLSHGILNANRVVAVCNAIRGVITKNPTSSMTTAQVLAIQELYAESIDAILGLAWSTRDMKATILAPLVLFHAAFPEKAMEFASAFIAMDGLRAKSPILVLRKWLLNSNEAQRHDRPDRVRVIHIVAQACCKYMDGESISLLKNTREGVDRIIHAQKSRARKVAELFAAS